MKMDLQTKQLLETEGFQVVEGNWDFKFKTRTFVRHPDGRLNPYYNTLYEIPVLPNGTEFDLNKAAMPYDEIYGRSTAIKDAQAIINADWGTGADGELFAITIFHIALAVILLAIVICIFFVINPPAQAPPCQTEERIIDVSDCAKIIIMPNCDSRLFDACNDEWLEDGWHTWEPPAGWITWVVIGVIAIGAIIIVPPLLKRAKGKNE